jgi:hypothetical protein
MLHLEQVCFFFFDFYTYSTNLNYLQVVVLLSTTYKYHHPPPPIDINDESMTAYLHTNESSRLVGVSPSHLRVYGSLNNHQRVTTTRWCLYGNYDGNYDHQRVTTTRWCVSIPSTGLQQPQQPPTSHDDSLVSLKQLRRRLRPPMSHNDSLVVSIPFTMAMKVSTTTNESG